MDNDYVGKIVAVVGAVFCLFILPLVVIALRTEYMTQSAIEKEIVEFVDNARSTGKITQNAYDDFSESITAWQSYLDVQMIHSSRMAMPDSTGGYEVYYEDFNRNDILDTIYNNGEEYRMRNGDFFAVTVMNVEPTLATRLYRVIVPNYNENGISIYATHNGMVGNYVED